MTQQEKFQCLADLITAQHQAQLHAQCLDCEANLMNAIATIQPGRKYTKIDIGSSGRYMIENETERIYGIKAYGVIHRGHYFGTLDTIDQYQWGGYYAGKLKATA